MKKKKTSHRVLDQARVVQELEQLPDQPRVRHHHVVVGGLPPPRLPELLGLRVRPEVHVGRVEPHEERLAGVLRARHEVDGLLEALVVDRLHALFRQGPRVGDLAVLAVEDAAGGVVLAEVGEVLLGGVVCFFSKFFFFFLRANDERERREKKKKKQSARFFFVVVVRFLTGAQKRSATANQLTRVLGLLLGVQVVEVSCFVVVVFRSLERREKIGVSFLLFLRPTEEKNSLSFETIKTPSPKNSWKPWLVGRYSSKSPKWFFPNWPVRRPAARIAVARVQSSPERPTLAPGMPTLVSPER